MTTTEHGSISSTLSPGETVAGKYVIERVIGAGGMGVVLAAHHPQLGQTVAIKLLNPQLASKPEVAARFLREARASARLRNQHIARVMDAGTDDRGFHYIVMEYLSGSVLRALYQRGARVPLEDTVGYVLHACEALAEAHAAGVIHRDLKPENLFLTRAPDGSPLIKVLDFGISKTLHLGPLTETTTNHVITSDQHLMGSPAYMSPEQLRTPEKVDARTDIWALGVILFELLSGKRPFAPPALADLIAEVLALTPPSPQTLRDDIPAELGAVVLKCIAKKADARFQNVGELAGALHTWAPSWARESAARAARTSGVTPLPEVTIIPSAGAEVANRGGARTVTPSPLLAASIAMSSRSRRGFLAGGTAVAVFLAFLVYLARSGTAVETLPSPPDGVTAPAGGAAATAPPPVPASPAIVPPSAPEAAEATAVESIKQAPPSTRVKPAGPARPGARRRPGGRMSYDGIRAPRSAGRLGPAAVDPLEGRR